MVQARQQRGQRRRDALVRAAADLAAEQGLASVSHRAVARRAGVPLGSTTYYFGSLNELLAELAGLLIERWIARGTTVVNAMGPGPFDAEHTADLLVRSLLPSEEYDTVLGYYEQLLGSARHAAVADVLRGGRPRLERLIEEILSRSGFSDRVSPGLALAVVDGAVVAALSEGRADVTAVARKSVIELLWTVPASGAS